MKGRAKHKRCLKLLPQMRYVMCSVFHGSVEEIILNLHWTPFNVVSVSHLQCLSILVSSYGGLCNSIGWCCLCGSGIGLIGCLELPTESSSQSPQARKPHEPDLGWDNLQQLQEIEGWIRSSFSHSKRHRVLLGKRPSSEKFSALDWVQAHQKQSNTGTIHIVQGLCQEGFVSRCVSGRCIGPLFFKACLSCGKETAGNSMAWWALELVSTAFMHWFQYMLGSKTAPH